MQRCVDYHASTACLQLTWVTIIKFLGHMDLLSVMATTLEGCNSGCEIYSFQIIHSADLPCAFELYLTTHLPCFRIKNFPRVSETKKFGKSTLHHAIMQENNPWCSHVCSKELHIVFFISWSLVLHKGTKIMLKSKFQDYGTALIPQWYAIAQFILWKQIYSD